MEVDNSILPYNNVKEIEEYHPMDPPLPDCFQNDNDIISFQIDLPKKYELDKDNQIRGEIEKRYSKQFSEISINLNNPNFNGNNENNNDNNPYSLNSKINDVENSNKNISVRDKIISQNNSINKNKNNNQNKKNSNNNINEINAYNNKDYISSNNEDYIIVNKEFTLNDNNKKYINECSIFNDLNSTTNKKNYNIKNDKSSITSNKYNTNNNQKLNKTELTFNINKLKNKNSLFYKKKNDNRDNAIYFDISKYKRKSKKQKKNVLQQIQDKKCPCDVEEESENGVEEFTVPIKLGKYSNDTHSHFNEKATINNNSSKLLNNINQINDNDNGSNIFKNYTSKKNNRSTKNEIPIALSDKKKLGFDYDKKLNDSLEKLGLLNKNNEKLENIKKLIDKDFNQKNYIKKSNSNQNLSNDSKKNHEVNKFRDISSFDISSNDNISCSEKPQKIRKNNSINSKGNETYNFKFDFKFSDFINSNSIINVPNTNTAMNFRKSHTPIVKIKFSNLKKIINKNGLFNVLTFLDYNDISNLLKSNKNMIFLVNRAISDAYLFKIKKNLEKYDNFIELLKCSLVYSIIKDTIKIDFTINFRFVNKMNFSENNNKQMNYYTAINTYSNSKQRNSSVDRYFENYIYNYDNPKCFQLIYFYSTFKKIQSHKKLITNENNKITKMYDYFTYDVYPEKSRHNTQIYLNEEHMSLISKNNKNLVYIQPILPFKINDKGCINFEIFSCGNHFIDPKSIKIVLKNFDLNNYLKKLDEKGINNLRICEYENICEHWRIINKEMNNQKFASIIERIHNIFDPCFNVGNIFYDNIGMHVFKVNLLAIKSGKISKEDKANDLRMNFIIKNKGDYVENEIKKNNLTFERRDIFELRVGDKILFYFTSKIK